MQSLFIFINQPGMRIVGKAQLTLAILVYFYFAWSSSPILVKTQPDWAMHFLGNGLLYGSFWWAFFYKRISWQLLLVLLPFSLAVELGQSLNPHRSVSLSDMLANAVGLCSACALGLYLQRFIPRSLTVEDQKV